MIEGLDRLLEGSGQPGLPELVNLLVKLLDGTEVRGRLTSQNALKTGIYRLGFELDGHNLSLVTKRLAPDIAKRNRLVAERWLPAVGLSQNGPPLLGTAADWDGNSVWHVYKDLGDMTLDTSDRDPERVKAALELIAQIHIRFADHALLAECRLWGGDLGIHFYTSSVRDAIRSLDSLRPPDVVLSPENLLLRDRLLERLTKLMEDASYRTKLLIELGGPETLLHGDLWTKNIFTIPTQNGFQARLIDWDHAAVGPISYDLSTFLYRFPVNERLWILNHYQELLARVHWHLPALSELNLLFETAELARIANRVIWPGIAVLDRQAEWGFDELAAVEQWFEMLEPALPL